MGNPLVDFYRCPSTLVDLPPPEALHPQSGYFAFGSGITCYGRAAIKPPAIQNGSPLPDLSRQLGLDDSTVQLPFDASEIIDNLRFERYPTNGNDRLARFLSGESIRGLYYRLRPGMSDSFRQSLQRIYLRNWTELRFPQWPVDTSVDRLLERLLRLSMKANHVDKIPFIWFWPDGARVAAMMTHDVETCTGLTRVPHLMDIDETFGITSAFQLVPEERYSVSQGLLESIRGRQCEVNVHGLDHNGNLFRDREEFSRQAKIINRYVHEFGAHGFRSDSMYRNAAWLEELNISYDMSMPNVAHLEPQRGGCCSVFPYFIGKTLELPLTTIQDYSLFHILGAYSTKLWIRQINTIMERHGLVSFIIHPDYIFSERALAVYKELLTHVSHLIRDQNAWLALPGDVNRWWRERSAMTLVMKDGRWRIEGPGRERARIAYASADGDTMSYTVGRSYEE